MRDFLLSNKAGYSSALLLLLLPALQENGVVALGIPSTVVFPPELTSAATRLSPMSPGACTGSALPRQPLSSCFQATDEV